MFRDYGDFAARLIFLITRVFQVQDGLIGINWEKMGKSRELIARSRVKLYRRMLACVHQSMPP